MLKHVLSLTLMTLVVDASVLDTAASNGCSQLVKLIDSAGLTSALKSAKGVTLFAPTDAALAAIPPEVMKQLTSNKTLLQDVLKFHVVQGAKKSTDLSDEQLLPTLSTNLNLRINIYNGGKVITAEGSPVSKANLMASNGVVHVIDKVIYPLPTLSLPLLLTFDKDLNNLGFLIFKAGLIDKLRGQSFTVFAPTNEAIEKIPSQQYNNLLMNATALMDFVNLHVVQGTVYSAGLSDGQRVKTVLGEELLIRISSSGVTVNGVKVNQADTSVSNGVVHVIDSYLTPKKSRSHGSIPILG